MPEFKSLGVRLEGSPEQIKEGVRRLRHVLFFSNVYDKEFPVEGKPQMRNFAYLRAYFYEPDMLLNQLEAAHRDIQHLTEALGEAELEIHRLREQLNQLPKAKPGDAVMGTSGWKN